MVNITICQATQPSKLENNGPEVESTVMSRIYSGSNSAELQFQVQPQVPTEGLWVIKVGAGQSYSAETLTMLLSRKVSKVIASFSHSETDGLAKYWMCELCNNYSCSVTGMCTVAERYLISTDQPLSDTPLDKVKTTVHLEPLVTTSESDTNFYLVSGVSLPQLKQIPYLKDYLTVAFRSTMKPNQPILVSTFHSTTTITGWFRHY